MEVQVIHNKLMDIIIESMEQEYKLGTNDCNIVALRIVDLFAGTDWSKVAKYKTIKAGLKQLNKLGFDSTQDIIKQYCDEVTIPIDGDIWLDEENPLIMAVVASGRLLGVNDNHDGFVLINKHQHGKYYRTRKV